MEREKLEKMSVMDLSLWLRENGVQDNYCELFEGIGQLVTLIVSYVYNNWGCCSSSYFLTFYSLLQKMKLMVKLFVSYQRLK